MTKRIRQYIGLLSAVLAYYLIHEGAHFLYAVTAGVFQGVRFMGLGMQIAVDSEGMSDTQLGIFCLVGVVATMLVAYLLIFLADRIGTVQSKVFKACMYYITIAMLLIDPLYLSLLCGFFGGGDMNGIALLVPEIAARIAFGILLILHAMLFWKIVLPKYRRAFAEGKA